MLENHTEVYTSKNCMRVEHRRESRVVVEVLHDAVRVGAALRHEGAGHRGDGQQQQQEQRRAHVGELAPEEAQVADDAEPRLGDAVPWRRQRGLDVVRGPGQNR